MWRNSHELAVIVFVVACAIYCGMTMGLRLSTLL